MPVKASLSSEFLRRASASGGVWRWMQANGQSPSRTLDRVCMHATRAQADDEEEETDALVNQVLDEIGINLDEQMVAAPGQKAAVSATPDLARL